MDDIGRVYGCVAQIDSDEFVIIGGTDKVVTKREIKAGKWIRLPDMSYPREGPACGHINGNLIGWEAQGLLIKQPCYLTALLT